MIIEIIEIFFRSVPFCIFGYLIHWLIRLRYLQAKPKRDVVLEYLDSRKRLNYVIDSVTFEKINGSDIKRMNFYKKLLELINDTTTTKYQIESILKHDFENIFQIEAI